MWLNAIQTYSSLALSCLIFELFFFCSLFYFYAGVIFLRPLNYYPWAEETICFCLKTMNSNNSQCLKNTLPNTIRADTAALTCKATNSHRYKHIFNFKPSLFSVRAVGALFSYHEIHVSLLSHFFNVWK